MKRKLILSLGMVASVVYLFAVALGGLIWPGYSQIRQAISELTMASAPNQWIMQPLFWIYNLLVLIFAVGLFMWAKNKLLRTSAVFLFLVGLSGIMMYFFPQDPLNAALTFGGLMHFVWAGVAALGTIAAIFAGGFGLARYEGQQAFLLPSVIFGTIVVVCGGMTPYAMTHFANTFGVFERTTIFSYIIWLSLFSYRLRGVLGEK